MKEEDFPVYQHLVSHYADNPGVQFAIKEFAKAQTGGDEEKFNFAWGLQTGLPDPRSWAPGTTEAMAWKTLESCLAVFEDVASRGHVRGAASAAYFHAYGFGCAADVGKANDFIEKAKSLAAGNPAEKGFAEAMAQMIPPRPAFPSFQASRKKPGF